jgi:hypothetical protein
VLATVEVRRAADQMIAGLSNIAGSGWTEGLREKSALDLLQAAQARLVDRFGAEVGHSLFVSALDVTMERIVLA